MGWNDSEEDAGRLIRWLKDIPAKVNLIPFNPWPGSFFECSDAATITRFADLLSAARISAPVRTTRGDDILAACGQLKSTSERQKKSERDTAGAQAKSEEHTSELQSLMRISSAVFCLKKKNYHQQIPTYVYLTDYSTTL